MTEVPISAEQVAILGLLSVGTSHSTSPPRMKIEDAEPPAKKIKIEEAEEEDEEERGDTDEETTVGSTQVSTRVLKIEKNDGIASGDTSPMPKPISPVPDPLEKSYNHMGMPLRKLSKKRKDHSTVQDQFEDADEGFFNSLQLGMIGAAGHAAISGKGVIGGYPPAPTLQREGSSEQPSSVPPPPHLIQQTSNEHVPQTPATVTSPPASLQAPSSAEIARQALAFQQQRAFMENSAAMFNPHFAAAFMAKMHGGAIAMGNGRMQAEILLALQAHMHMARQHTNGPQVPVGGICSSSENKLKDGIPGFGTMASSQMPPLMSASASQASDEPVSETLRKSHGTGTAEHGDGSASSNKLQAARAMSSLFVGGPVTHSMRPPQPKVESDEDNSDGSGGSNGGGERKMKCPKGASTMSTKVRYEKYTPPSSWGEICRVPKMPAVKADDKYKHPIETLRENDVMLGRGGLSNQNEGNIRFRNLVRNYRMHYCTAPKGDKGALSRYLCNYVRAMGGRFLSKSNSADDAAWYEVGDDKAVSKCAQALREGTAEFSKKRRGADDD